MGSRNKKTKKLSYYNVTVTDFKITDCECPAGSSVVTLLVNI